MHVTIVHVHVKEDKIDEFIAASLENHENSVREAGNRRFDVLQDVNEPTKFILYEAYATAEDALAHKDTRHYLTWRDSVADMMAEPRQGVPYKALAPTR